LVDEYDFIDVVWDNKKIALFGAAGSGKSMFMRYFWISCAVQPRGKIPLFIELRKFNELSNEDFTSFIFSIAVNSQEQKAKNLFKAAIE
jgi:predicted NACHT family NTPase